MEDGIDYDHKQRDFIDFFQYQNIMPHKFSQIGPCMAQGDLNGDGNNDLILGSSDTNPTTVYIRNENGFERQNLTG